MPKFRALVRGTNLRLHSEDQQRAVPGGFYVTVFVEAASPHVAETDAIALVRQSHAYSAAVNSAEDPPRIAVEQIDEIEDWPSDTQRPLTGFALFDESVSAYERTNI
jgi:hypothetical protein